MLEGDNKADTLLETKVVVEPVVDVVDEAEDCRLTDWRGVCDTNAVELILGDGLGDGAEELETEVVVELVADVIDDGEGSKVCVWKVDCVIDVVELILGDELGECWADIEDVVEGECEADSVGVVVVDTKGLGVPDIE